MCEIDYYGLVVVRRNDNAGHVKYLGLDDLYGLTKV